MSRFNKRLSLSSIALVAGSVLSVPSVAHAGPDDSVWYQPPQRVMQPAPQQVNRNHIHVSNRSSYGRHSGYSYSRYGSTNFGTLYSGSRYGRSYSSCYPYSRSYNYTPRYQTYSSYRYSRPSVISIPSSSTRITYVTPVVQETQYSSRQSSGAYDAVSYREYQRLLAEQRVLRQQVLDQQRQREQEAAAAPTYNPGPPVPSNSPLSLAKQSLGSDTKPDRPRSGDEVLPPVPRESSVQLQNNEQATGSALPSAWEAIAGGRYDYAMLLFADLAGEQEASTADRVGFALAAAGMGQRERAAWAMRRVLMADPDGFGFVPASDELRSTLNRLAADMARDMQARPDGPDRRMLAFLTASVEYLALDMESGLEYLDQARVDGADYHEGAVRLRQLLEESGAKGF